MFTVLGAYVEFLRKRLLWDTAGCLPVSWCPKKCYKKKEKSERNRRRTQTKNGKWWIGLGFTLSALILCFVLYLVSFVFLMTSLGQPDNERASKEPAVLHLWICTLHFYSRPSLESEYIQLSSPRAGGRFLGHCDIQITSLPCSSW